MKGLEPMSLDLLIEKIAYTSNPTVVGLDPRLEYIPDFIKKKSYECYGMTFEAAGDAVLTFNKILIDALCDIVPAVKPQCAYYEMFGWQGVKALAETIEYAHSHNMFVIADGKRNDIGSTMEAYAQAYLGQTEIGTIQKRAFETDALTVNPYLGSDGIIPLTDICAASDKGIFVLCKTSNPSSGELQDLDCGGMPMYMRVAELAEKWGAKVPGKYGYNGVGIVAGATYPEQLMQLRKRLPNTMFLIPGYGAQGGRAHDIACAFGEGMTGVIVNSSRAIMCAYQKSGNADMNFAQAARTEALLMRDALRDAAKDTCRR